MNQFDICRNTSISTRKDVPYLLDMQSEAMSVLNTRLVVPLRKTSEAGGRTVKRIHITLSVGTEPYIAFVSEMAAVPLTHLGAVEGSAVSHRTELIAAIDLLITGF